MDRGSVQLEISVNIKQTVRTGDLVKERCINCTSQTHLFEDSFHSHTFSGYIAFIVEGPVTSAFCTTILFFTTVHYKKMLLFLLLTGGVKMNKLTRIQQFFYDKVKGIT